MALGTEVVDLVLDAWPGSNPSGLRPGGLNFLDDADQVGRVGEVSVMEMKPHRFLVGVLVEVVHPVGVSEFGRVPALSRGAGLCGGPVRRTRRTAFGAQGCIGEQQTQFATSPSIPHAYTPSRFPCGQ